MSSGWQEACRYATQRPVHGSSGRHPRDLLRQELGLFDTIMLCVSSIIGAGVFFTPGTVAMLLPAPGLFLAVWVAGGLLSLAGALANAELGAMYPRAGGDYVYLREAYHPVAGFVAGWLSFFVIYAGTVATLALGFAEGANRWLGYGRGGLLFVACAVVAVVSAVNYMGVRRGARLNNLTALVKLAAIVTLALWALKTGKGTWDHLQPWLPDLHAGVWSNFGLALSPVLFSYLGWNAPVYVASEIRQAERTIPVALFTGLALCTGVYLLLNLVYLYALPVGDMPYHANVGEAAAGVLFGELGGSVIAGLVLASVLGCLNATVLVGPRIAYAMALDGYFFLGIDRVHARYGTPHTAIIVQALAAMALVVVLQGFPRVLDYTTFAIVLLIMADTSALYALRRRRPHLPRPYRAWGYPWLPALYFLANGAIAVAMIWGRPRECVIALAVTAAALPFYRRFAPRARGGEGWGKHDKRVS